MRQVDCVTVKGSTKPVGLFTYDVDVEGLQGLRLAGGPDSGAVPRPSNAAAAAAAEEGAAEGSANPGGHETFSARAFANEFAGGWVGGWQHASAEGWTGSKRYVEAGRGGRSASRRYLCRHPPFSLPCRAPRHCHDTHRR